MQKSSSTFLFGLVIGGVLGAALGGLFLSDRDDYVELAAARPGDPSVAAPVEPTKSLANMERPEPAAEPAERAPAVRDATPERVSEEQVKGLVAALPQQEVEERPGDGALWGRVADAAGVGLPDVVLRAQPTVTIQSSTSVPLGQGPPPLTSLKDVVRRAAKNHTHRRARLREVRTDADGVFRFEGLDETFWQVTAYKEGWVFESQPLSYRARVGQAVDFQGDPVVSIPVEVFLPDGSQPDEAVLVVERNRGRGRSSGNRFTWTPAEPLLRVRDRRTEISARAVPFESEDANDAFVYRSPSAVYTPEPGAQPAPMRFDLVARSGIQGRVIQSDNGVRARSMRVYAMPIAAAEKPDLERLRESERNTYLRSGAGFQFVDLPPGKWVVGVGRSYASPISVHEVVEVGSGIEECLLEMPAIDFSRSIVATVRGADGAALDGVSFRFSHKGPDGSSRHGMQPMRMADGRYLLDVPSDAFAAYFETTPPETTFGLRISHDSYGEQSVPLKKGQTSVETTFVVPAEVTVSIDGYVGSGYEGRLSVGIQRRGDGRSSSPDNNDAGVFRLSPQEPGSYKVRLLLQSTGRRRSDNEIASVDVELEAGSNSVRLTIPALYSLSLHGPDLAPGTTVRVYGTGGSFGREEARLGEDRRASIDELPAGRYRVQARGSKRVELEVDVPCGIVVLEHRERTALRVSISDAAGAIAKAGFREGDLVIGAGGEEFESERDFMRVLGGSGDTVDLLVLRGKRTLRITLTREAIRSPSSMGGSFRPVAR
ncbi:MAG: PDZ domain-containing protein [bacterium]|nr:PDZ domain-containing protein [bacterium]